MVVFVNILIKKEKDIILFQFQGTIDDKPFYNSIVVPLINSLRTNKKSINFKKRKKYGKIEMNFTDKILFNKLKEIGFPGGKKGSKLEIPKIFYEKNLLKYVVQGFFATDGSLVLTRNPNKYYPRIEGTGIYKKLVFQISDYLNELGMKGYFYTAKRNKADGFSKLRQQPYRFQFNGKGNLLIFKELVGFINPKHHERFVKFLSYDSNYDKAIKGIQTSLHKKIRGQINSRFIRNMAALGVEPRTPSS